MAPQSAMMKLGQISPAPFELENDSDGRLFLTAKTTAEPTDDCGYGWTIADCSRAGPNLYGRPWTFADGSSAVFKTVWGRPWTFAQVRQRPPASVLEPDDSQ